MRASSQGSITTLLLLIPILAVPLIAIFGVPEISTDQSQPRLEDEFPELAGVSSAGLDAEEFDPTRPQGSRALDALPSNLEPQTGKPRPGNSLAGGASDLPLWNDNHAFADSRNTPKPTGDDWGGSTTDNPEAAVPSAFPTGAAVPLRARENSLSTTPAADEMAINVGDSSRVVPAGNVEISPSDFPRDRTTEPPRSVPRANAIPAGPLTWQDAVQRLHALQIRNFRLEPGAEPSVFVFICSYTPADNPRISYRFEAEANEPLKAVEKVLQQIEEWRAQR
ncbi:MAG: hypothetical protein C0478_07445 [Planctomyces sp.]|nr:hypothetical protein [Planctomyces sp.]